MTVESNNFKKLKFVERKSVIRKCIYYYQCQKSETHNGRRWIEHWHKHPSKQGYLCKNHYRTLILTPRTTTEQHRYWRRNVTPEYKRKYNMRNSPRRIWFKGKSISLTFEPRKGYCNWCLNNVYDGSTYQTEMHHLEYYIIFPWFATIELCSSCHASKTEKKKKV